MKGLPIPPIQIVNPHTPRTVHLLGEAYRKQDPVVTKRLQYVAELGQVALPEAAPFLIEAMNDESTQVRAEAARSARMIEDASVLSPVHKLVTDPDPSVRREAVLATAKITREQRASTDVINRGLDDADSTVIAAALQAAWTPDHAQQVAKKLLTLPETLKVEASLALSRLKAQGTSTALIPLLNGSVPQRVAALHALGEIGDRANAEAVLQKLIDPHPTVRRAAILAVGHLADESIAQSNAINMLSDTDPTVREAAAYVLTPMPSNEALVALAGQLNESYAPLHNALRQTLIQPADAALRDATIELAAKLLDDPNPRRREDASFILGGLWSNAAIDRHIALLAWDATNPLQTDWPLVAQAAESVGRIGDAKAIDRLMSLARSAPDAAEGLPKQHQVAMIRAMANAITSLAQLHHAPALPEAVRILALDPQKCPAHVRASSAFAVGMLDRPNGEAKFTSPLLKMYGDIYESHEAKFEAIKALGNLRHTPAVERLKSIAESDGTAELRWIAHWAYQRASDTTVIYHPPTRLREVPTCILDLPTTATINEKQGISR